MVSQAGFTASYTVASDIDQELSEEENQRYFKKTTTVTYYKATEPERGHGEKKNCA